jgi:hypothetical protein
MGRRDLQMLMEEKTSKDEAIAVVVAL